MKIYHVADKHDEEVSYFQQLTDNTIVLLSNEAFVEIREKYFSNKDNIVYLNEALEEFIPSLSFVIDGYKRIIQNDEQTITFFVYSDDGDEYDILLSEFCSSVKCLEDIWLVETNPFYKKEIELVAFTEYEDAKIFLNPISKLRNGILQGRFGFLFPESRFV